MEFLFARFGSPRYYGHHEIIPNTQIENSLLFGKPMAPWVAWVNSAPSFDQKLRPKISEAIDPDFDLTNETAT